MKAELRKCVFETATLKSSSEDKEVKIQVRRRWRNYLNDEDDRCMQRLDGEKWFKGDGKFLRDRMIEIRVKQW